MRRGYQGQVKAPRITIHLADRADSLRKRTKAALVRFKRWEKNFGQKGAECRNGMKLCQLSIGRY